MLPIHTEESSLLQKHTLRNGRALLIFLKLVTPVVFIALAIVSILSSSGKLPISNKELTDKYQVLLSPASYAFSIWGLIYFLQACASLYGVLPFDYEKDVYILALHLFLPLGWIMEITWQFVFANDLVWLSVITIVSSWACFVFAWLRVWDVNDERPTTDTFSLLKYVVRKGIYVVSTSMNFAWLTCASVINMLILARAEGYSPSSGICVALLCLVTLKSFLCMLWKGDLVHPSVVSWALIAISLKQAAEEIKIACYSV
eukprot:TRINITY_DN225_c0_g1_i2.p1 TRINITY_DN225_c0_g1~~TRINITY_DN225_c0_g1_i2.p1  ORF type:complete len:259 (+),score=35.21 TRINITY_DN225_c0_g1_i2:147-923(+)